MPYSDNFDITKRLFGGLHYGRRAFLLEQDGTSGDNVEM